MEAMKMTTTIADDIWVILREVAQAQKDSQKELQDAQKQTEREIKAVNVSIGRLSNRLGEFVEEAVRPSAVRLFRERGIDVHEVQQNIIVKRDGEGLEIDLLVINDKDAVVIECKSNGSIWIPRSFSQE